MIETTLMVAVLAIAAIGAAIDVARRLLPNILCAVLAIAAIAFSWANLGFSGLASPAIHAAISLGVGVALFAMGVVGGGDAKFYAAGAFAVPLGKALTMLLWTVFGGLALLIVMAVWNLVSSRGKRSVAEMRKMQLPYGVAIAIGLAAALLNP